MLAQGSERHDFGVQIDRAEAGVRPFDNAVRRKMRCKPVDAHHAAVLAKPQHFAAFIHDVLLL